MRNRIFVKNIEPSVDELLADPIAHLLMTHDGVRVCEVIAIVDRARTALRQRPFEAASAPKAA